MNVLSFLTCSKEGHLSSPEEPVLLTEALSLSPLGDSSPCEGITNTLGSHLFKSILLRSVSHPVPSPSGNTAGLTFRTPPEPNQSPLPPPSFRAQTPPPPWMRKSSQLEPPCLYSLSYPATLKKHLRSP